MKSFRWFPALLVIAGVIMMLPATGLASQEDYKENISDYFNVLAYNSGSMSMGGSANYFQEGEEDVFEGDIYEYKKKSTTRAFFYSLVIPGAGQFYAGSKIKPYIFFGLDVGLWTATILYNKKGKDTEDEFRDYADQHYIRNYYDDWWNHVIQTDPGDTSRYSHRLPQEKDHEYYENIGKYDQFRWGWDDYLPEWADVGKWNSPQADSSKYFITPHRDEYLQIRKDANDYFDRSTTFLVIAMANHVVSAFDAAFTAKRYNNKLMSGLLSDLKIRMIPRRVDTDIYPQLTLYKNF
ncbi:MAG: hypothetical protein GF307_10225 [candidate division Zixibacteria bacterium]|nr:hypothetical protein [candidate division Zixibacteria bacterium]